MALNIPCPKCQLKLSVPEAHAGKRVKCPKCGEIFAVPGRAAPPPPPPPPQEYDVVDVVEDAPKKPAPAKAGGAIVRCPKCKKRYDPGIDVADTLEGMPGNVSLKVVCPACGQWLRLPERDMIEAPAAAPEMLRQMRAQARLVDDDSTVTATPPRKAKRDDDFDGVDADDDARPRRPRDDEDEDEDDQPRRKKKKRRRSDVRAMVSYPATALKIVAYVGAAVTILFTIVEFGILIAGAGSPPPGMPPGSESYRIGSIVGLIVRIPITLAWSRYLISAAESMECLEGYTKIILACCVAALPCSLGCFGGIPVAIWILAVVVQTDVRKAFSS